jgi:acetyl esterase
MAENEQTAPADLLAQLFGARLPTDVHEMRAFLDRLASMMNAGLPEIGAFHERVPICEVEGTRVTADVAVPKGPGPHPVLVYFHGGGWVCGSPATHRKLAHRFAEKGYLVWNVDYRLAPEHPFPAAVDDCVTAIRVASRGAERFGGDATRLAVGGDSAGGNLTAAALGVLAGDASAPRVSAALLLYGVFDFERLGDLPPQPGPFANAAMLEAGGRMIGMMVDAYLGPDPSAERLRDPRVSPIHVADRLPPAYVLVGTLDPLAAQAESLAAALARAGIPYVHDVAEGMPHGFAQMEFFPQAREAITRMGDFLDVHLGVG